MNKSHTCNLLILLRNGAFAFEPDVSGALQYIISRDPHLDLNITVQVNEDLDVPVRFTVVYSDRPIVRFNAFWDPANEFVVEEVG